MALQFCCGFECGVSGAHWTTAGTWESASPRNGTYCLTLGAGQTASAIGLTGSALLSARFYVRFNTLPTADSLIWLTRDAVFTNDIGVVFKSSDSTIRAGIGTGTLSSTGIPVTTGVWYLIDTYNITTSGTQTVRLKVNGGVEIEVTASNGIGSNPSTVIAQGGTNGNISFDDVVIGTLSSDYPIGPGYVHAFTAVSDGTHNVAGANDFERTLTGTDILNATTDAYTLVNKVPLTTTIGSFINMVAPPNATDYVECVMGAAPGVPSPPVAPRIIAVLAAIHQAGTGLGNMEIRLNDNGTMGTVYTATGVAGTTGISFKRAHFADPPSAATKWTLASGDGDFNNLKIRFGSPAALDVNPDQYFDAIMIEAEFSPLTHKVYKFLQAVNRANRY